jgi:uncharacterized membrane protein HdeD (DUF308 family)
VEHKACLSLHNSRFSLTAAFGMDLANKKTRRMVFRYRVRYPGQGDPQMRTTAIIGLLLIVLGVVALAFQGFTFFTHERVLDAGPFHVDVAKPHTIILHPVVGVVALVAGVVLLLVGRRAVD